MKRLNLYSIDSQYYMMFKSYSKVLFVITMYKQIMDGI
jgi:hypothetical protein